MKFGTLWAAFTMSVLAYVAFNYILPMLCIPASSGQGRKKNSSSGTEETSRKRASRDMSKEKIADQKTRIVPIKRKRRRAS
jgi:hypothetical protein